MTPTPISPEAWEAYRSTFRSLGPRHRSVDRWRHTLKWTIAEPVVANYLAEERAKLAEGNRRIN
jgi:hypothetical protein